MNRMTGPLRRRPNRRADLETGAPSAIVDMALSLKRLVMHVLKTTGPNAIRQGMQNILKFFYPACAASGRENRVVSFVIQFRSQICPRLKSFLCGNDGVRSAT